MSSLPSFSAESLSEFSAASDRKKITDAFNQAYKELVDNPMDSYNMDIQSPSIPISFLYDLSNDNSSRGCGSSVLLRTTSSNDLSNFNNIDEAFSNEDYDKRAEFASIIPTMPVERAMSAPCITNVDERDLELGDDVDQSGHLTLNDFDRHLLAQITNTNSAAQSGPGGHQQSTIFNNQYRYEFVLCAPISIVQKKGDDTLTYLNKGQYYNIKFLSNPANERMDFNHKIQTIIHLVFRNQDRKKEYEYWNYWYSQQPNSNIRVFDIDERSCKHVEKINEIGCNAVSFTWNSNIGAEIGLRINCLSTEFSSQKGVKGTPLYLQLDTFEDTESLNPEPADRCYCQIKVFRDKGAERKNKDEARTAERKLQKLLKTGQISPSDRNANDLLSVFHKPSKETILSKTTTMSPRPVIFTAPVRNLSLNNMGEDIPQLNSEPKYYTPPYVTSPTFSSPTQMTHCSVDMSSIGSVNSVGSLNNINGTNTGSAIVNDQLETSWTTPSPTKNPDTNSSLVAFIRERETKRTLSQALTISNEGPPRLSVAGSSDDMSRMSRPNKVARIQKPKPVTIYVKKKDQKIYNAICLTKATLDDLKEEIGVKYSIPKNMVVKLYKRNKRGLLIHMDNRMVEQFQDEDDFNIEISFQNKEGIFEVTFIY